MVEQPIFKLQNLTKTYILGRNKNAKKAQKAIARLQKQYENLVANNKTREASQLEKKISTAQQQFTDEKYEASYKTVTGNSLTKRKAKGTVVHALNGVSLEIKPGEMVAVVGPSGSGKSTLLNMLGLLDTPSSGQIFLNGDNVAKIKKHNLPALRSDRLGFVFQSFNLVPTLTAIENVMLPLKYSGIRLSERRRLAAEALRRVGLGDRLNHQPAELSGGQQQRVAIARSIVNQPAVVFGDELTGELDTKMTADVMKLIKQLNKTGQTFIIVTHNPEVAKACKRIIHMRDGQVERQVTNRH